MNEKMKQIVADCLSDYRHGHCDEEQMLTTAVTDAWYEATNLEREACAEVCFDPTTLCAAPIHCGCREDIARDIRERGQGKEDGGE